MLSEEQLTSSPPRSSRPLTPTTALLLPSARISPERADHETDISDKLQVGLEIERPKSALHKGDFTQQGELLRDHPRRRKEPRGRIEEQSGASWRAPSPPAHFSSFFFPPQSVENKGFGSSQASTTSVLPSSISSSFAYQPPTTPLVQSQSNEDLDQLSEPIEDISLSSSFGRRRCTLASANSSPVVPSPFQSSGRPRAPLHRREGSIPYMAHQPRRSLTTSSSFQFPTSSPQTPILSRSRRPSVGSESSPLHHASMVGSYEESILRGRMSTTPSRPLDFVAQIGVLGKGKCRSSLRCPPHVTVPFPAVYYSYNTTTHGRPTGEDGPSPYVGQVDLENGLSNPEDGSRSRRKVQSRAEPRPPTEDVDMLLPHEMESEQQNNNQRNIRSRSPKAPPGGSYRIPEKGQIQIIIKNQNKTAVKLFLVPYDLSGMEPGSKTFIRQRSYSAGSTVDEGSSSTSQNSTDRPTLRYLVHLHICCPARGRFYLYKSIRIVFANRVPEGMEKLRNETTWPEPRFSPYKPVRLMRPPLSVSNGGGALLTAEKASRRRSLGVPIGISTGPFDMTNAANLQPLIPSSIAEHQNPSASGLAMSSCQLIDPVPFRLPNSHTRAGSDASDATNLTAAMEVRSLESSGASRPSTMDSGADTSSSWSVHRWEKLKKGEFGYGGNTFSAPSVASGVGPTEGLLSQRLRSLGVKTSDLLPGAIEDSIE